MRITITHTRAHTIKTVLNCGRHIEDMGLMGKKDINPCDHTAIYDSCTQSAENNYTNVKWQINLFYNYCHGTTL